MKCKDFKFGESVIIYSRIGEHKFDDTVVKVGRKYVTTSRGYRFCEDDYFEFSLINDGYGSSMQLFKDDEAVLNHQNKINALSKIKNVVDTYQLEKYKKVYIDQILEIIKKGAQEIK